MNILVLGSTGFIGKNLVDQLKKQKHNVTTAERSSNVDIRNYDQILQKIKDCNPQIIYNLASHGGSVHYVKSKPAEVYHDNVQMGLNLYKAVAEVNNKIKIIQPFSNCSYPGDSDIQKENQWLRGDVHPSVFSFGNSKRSIYCISKCYNQQFDINTVNMLFPNTYGPGDSEDPNHTHALNGMIIRMLQAKKDNKKDFVIWGTGKPVREWLYIDDFIKALIMGLQVENMIEPINVAQEKGYSIFESAKIIKKSCNFEGNLIFDESYTDGDPIKIMGKEKFTNYFSDFIFYNHEQGIKNTVLYYQNIIL